MYSYPAVFNFQNVTNVTIVNRGSQSTLCSTPGKANEKCLGLVENYFVYKDGKECNFHEFIVYNLYFGIIRGTNVKSDLFTSYLVIGKKYSSSLKELSEWRNSNEILSIIGNYIKSDLLDDDDPLLSAIIDVQDIKMDLKKHHLYNKLKKCIGWEEFSQDDTIGIVSSLSYHGKRMCKLTRNFIDQVSQMVNKSTYSHDIISSYMRFLAPDIFVRWESGQSLASKDCGVQKYPDIIGTKQNSKLNCMHEILYGEISYGPFNSDAEEHIDNDCLKIGKLGKDGLDRIKRLLNTSKVQIILIHFFGKFI
nr:8363_t:CDS:2 [Entrophospora candida]